MLTYSETKFEVPERICKYTCTFMLQLISTLKQLKQKISSKGERMVTFLVRNVLITDDFPTFGYPTKPTDIACLSLFNLANCLSTDRSEP